MEESDEASSVDLTDEETVESPSVADSEEEESDEASSVDLTEEETVGSPSVADSEEENGGSSSERGNKRLKLEEKEDRISALPDSLIQRFLSFLPSTKEAIRTGILSNRWKNQWTRAPVLIFDFGMSSDISVEAFARFIDNSLLQYDCSKIKKLHLAYDFGKDTNFCSKIRFATRKDVEELILIRDHSDDRNVPYLLPKFIFDNASLVKLQMLNCWFQHSWRINWASLKALKLDGRSLGYGRTMKNVLSGSPLLESLEINRYWVNNFVIASKSLKILILVDFEISGDFEISCPNLEEFSVKVLDLEAYVNFPHKTIANVLSGSPLLHSLQLTDLFFDGLVVASKSLKKLLLRDIYEGCPIEISCPNLEELNLYGLNIETCKLMNLPSSCCAALHFNTPPLKGCGVNLVGKILEELHHVKELKVGRWFIKIFSALGTGPLSYPSLNIKCLTLDGPNFEHILGIVNALRCSLALERLVIKLQLYKYQKTADLPALNKFEETYRNVNGTGYTCLASHLKTVKIIGLSKKDVKSKFVLQFIEFILKNARALEKMVVTLKDGGTEFLAEVSQKLLRFPRCSQHGIIELL